MFRSFGVRTTSGTVRRRVFLSLYVSRVPLKKGHHRKEVFPAILPWIPQRPGKRHGSAYTNPPRFPESLRLLCKLGELSYYDTLARDPHLHTHLLTYLPHQICDRTPDYRLRHVQSPPKRQHDISLTRVKLNSLGKDT